MGDVGESASVNIVVRADVFQHYRLGLPLLHEREDDSKIVAGTASPRIGHVAGELVGSQARIENVRGQELERGLHVGIRAGLPLHDSLGGAHECGSVK
jgi:hypothetical protein